MSADRTKILNGPFNYDVKNGESTSVLSSAISGREQQKVVINTEPVTEEAGDHTTEDLFEIVKVEINLHELDTTMMDDIEDELGVTHEIEFPLKSKKLTISNPDRVKCVVSGGKTKVMIEKAGVDGNRPYTIGSIT